MQGSPWGRRYPAGYDRPGGWDDGTCHAKIYGRTLVAQLAAAAGYEVVEFGADGGVKRRGLEPLERPAPDVPGPVGGVLAAQLQPALEVGGRGQQRAVEARAEALHRVLG